jgi:hypothetical protein
LKICYERSYNWLNFLSHRKETFQKCSFRHNATSSIQSVFITGQINKVRENCLHPQSIIQTRKDIICFFICYCRHFFHFFIFCCFRSLILAKMKDLRIFVSSINSHKFRLTNIPLLFYILFYHTEIFLCKKNGQRKVWYLSKCNSYMDKNVNNPFKAFVSLFFFILSGFLPF